MGQRNYYIINLGESLEITFDPRNARRWIARYIIPSLKTLQNQQPSAQDEVAEIIALEAYKCMMFPSVFASVWKVHATRISYIYIYMHIQ